tara:strand:+ start:1275 stop:1568 length:294 start_codon:yes stop_codon:yes gene_type:complete
MERNRSYPLSSLEVQEHKKIASKTSIGKYCHLEDGILTITDHHKYTDTLNMYWHNEAKSMSVERLDSSIDLTAKAITIPRALELECIMDSYVRGISK